MRVPAALVILSAAVVLAADKPCTARADGQYFDLSRLIAKKDYNFKLPNGEEAALNVCGALTGETWKLDDAKDLGGSVRRDHGDFSLGKYNETLLVKDGMPMLIYENGSKCPKSDDMKGSAIIRFICDKNVYAAGTPQLIAQFPSGDKEACAYFFSWRTHLACPTTESSWSGFGSFLYILFMGFLSIGLLYIVVGICYRRYALNLRGADVLPRFGLSSIREVFEFCKDALEDLFQRRSDPFDRYGSAWSGWRTQSSGREPRGSTGYTGYRNVPSQHNEEEAILGEGSDDEDEDGEEEQPTPANARPSPNAPPGGFVRPGPQAPGPAPWNDQANVARPVVPASSAPGRPPVQAHLAGRPAAPPAGPSPWSDQANVPQRAQPPPPQASSGAPPPPPAKGDESDDSD